MLEIFFQQQNDEYWLVTTSHHEYPRQFTTSESRESTQTFTSASRTY